MPKKSSSKKIRIENVRLSFAHFFQRDQYGNFSANFIFAKDHPATKTMLEAIKEVAANAWGDGAADALKSLKAQNRLCLHDGDTKDTDGYAGNLFISANSSKRPLVLDKDRSSLSEEDGRPYSGCYVNAVLNIWSQDNQWGKRVNADVLGVQFFADGESFGGGAVASVDEFDEIEGGAESDTLGAPGEDAFAGLI